MPSQQKEFKCRLRLVSPESDLSPVLVNIVDLGGDSRKIQWRRVEWLGEGRKATECVLMSWFPIVGCGAPLYRGPAEKLCGTHLRIISSGISIVGEGGRVAGLRCVSIDNHPPLGEDFGREGRERHECPALPLCALLWNPHIGAGKALWQWRRETQVFEVDRGTAQGSSGGWGKWAGHLEGLPWRAAWP